LIFAIDLVDTAIKGADHFAALGPGIWSGTG
jgi:hypothetical protein